MIKIDHVTYRYDEEHTALKDISLEINKGEMLAIVGHNGSGKSTLAKHLNALLLPTEGRVEVDGMDTAVEANTLNIRKKVGMVFQNPDNQIVTTIVEEDVAFGPENLGVPPEEIRRRVNEALKAVGMEKYARSAPHMLSGGQKQRIGIARALALEPDIIICDEAVSALDVSVQAQVLNLLQELKEKLGLTYFFISHNLNVVYQVSDRVGVMYLGKMVEIANYDQLYEKRYHPYTEALLSAIPIAKVGAQRKRILLKGEITSPINPKPGCRFAPRCLHARPECFNTQPQLTEITPGHFVACHLHSK